MEEKSVKNEHDEYVDSWNSSAVIIDLCIFQALNNGHRRASSPQSSSSTAPTTALNPTRSGTTTGTGLRGRPPKIRKEIQTQSSVNLSIFHSQHDAEESCSSRPLMKWH